MSKTISQVIRNFTQQAMLMNLLDATDEIYVINRLLDIVGEASFDQTVEQSQPVPPLLTSMDEICCYCITKKMMEPLNYQIEELEARIMDLLTPSPSNLNRKFWDLYKEAPQKATDYFYQLSQANDYIKTRQIEKNIAFSAKSPYGDLELTVIQVGIE